jgi:hypothetical protein
MTLTLLITIGVCWILGLATIWILFLMWLRWRAFTARDRLRTRQIEALGMTTTDENDPERAPMSDAEEAWRESVARRRAHYQREAGERLR